MFFFLLAPRNNHSPQAKNGEFFEMRNNISSTSTNKHYLPARNEGLITSRTSMIDEQTCLMNPNSRQPTISIDIRDQTTHSNVLGGEQRMNFNILNRNQGNHSSILNQEHNFNILGRTEASLSNNIVPEQTSHFNILGREKMNHSNILGQDQGVYSTLSEQGVHHNIGQDQSIYSNLSDQINNSSHVCQDNELRSHIFSKQFTNYYDNNQKKNIELENNERLWLNQGEEPYKDNRAGSQGGLRREQSPSHNVDHYCTLRPMPFANR